MRIVVSERTRLEIDERNKDAEERNGAFVLVHGIQGTLTAWHAVAGYLGDKRRIIMPNLRGRGGSYSPDNPEAYTLKAFSSDLSEVLMEAPSPVTLVGWSMGVLVALAYIANYGEKKISQLVLASGTAFPEHDVQWFRGRTLPEIEAEARERAKRLELTNSASALATAASWQAIARADLRYTLQEITVPTYVLHGGLDKECPLRHGKLIAESIPTAIFENWPDGGHNLMADNPKRFAESLKQYSRYSQKWCMRH